MTLNQFIILLIQVNNVVSKTYSKTLYLLYLLKSLGLIQHVLYHFLATYFCGCSMYLSIITFNVNGLNYQMIRFSWPNWLKTDPIYMLPIRSTPTSVSCPQEYISPTMIHILKVEGWKWCAMLMESKTRWYIQPHISWIRI